MGNSKLKIPCWLKEKSLRKPQIFLQEVIKVSFIKLILWVARLCSHLVTVQDFSLGHGPVSYLSQETEMPKRVNAHHCWLPQLTAVNQTNAHISHCSSQSEDLSTYWNLHSDIQHWEPWLFQTSPNFTPLPAPFCECLSKVSHLIICPNSRPPHGVLSFHPGCSHFSWKKSRPAPTLLSWLRVLAPSPASSTSRKILKSTAIPFCFLLFLPSSVYSLHKSSPVLGDNDYISLAW